MVGNVFAGPRIPARCGKSAFVSLAFRIVNSNATDMCLSARCLALNCMGNGGLGRTSIMGGDGIYSMANVTNFRGMSMGTSAMFINSMALNSISVSNSVAIFSTARIRGCVIRLITFAGSRFATTSISRSDAVAIGSTAAVRGFIMGLVDGFWWILGRLACHSI